MIWTKSQTPSGWSWHLHGSHEPWQPIGRTGSLHGLEVLRAHRLGKVAAKLGRAAGACCRAEHLLEAAVEHGGDERAVEDGEEPADGHAAL